MKFVVAVCVAVCAYIMSPVGARAESATLCEQKVDYTMKPLASDVPADLRGFVGLWSGDSIMAHSKAGELSACIGFIIESIGPGNRVVARHVWGSRTKSLYSGMTFERKPGTSTWEGTLAGNELRFTGKTTYELHLSGANELRGSSITDQGRGTVVLKRR